MVNTARNLLIMLNNLLQMHLKLLQKEQINKTAETSGDLSVNKISDKMTSLDNFATE